MNKFRIFIALLFVFSLSSCSYIAEKKDKWFGDSEVVEVVPVEEVVESTVEDTLEEDPETME